ncbi:WD40 repeat [Ostreococcus tauri]|uniref:WD40 repeat n=1 Tax=Ostreococcus tauri TaxID=70448 RepID=A0A090N4H6_OSTTA|nr:WD40 repeat [Ostreococcus tauri]CEF99883.1 WD40 repeat [Ostreococcus tauri]|eukprot:XP_003082320.2 WD40 repeat [Ostreococcus tauri]
MTKNKSLKSARLARSFGFDFRRRQNLIKIRNSVVAYAVGNLLTVLDLGTREQKYVRTGERGEIGFIAANPEGTLIAVGENGESPRICIHSYPSLQLKSTIHGGAEAVYTTGKFSPDGKLIASVSGLPDYWLTLWDLEMGAIVLRAKAHGQEVYDVSFRGGSSERLVTYGAGHIQFWRMVKTFTGLKLQGTLGKFNGEPLCNITGALELPYYDMMITSTDYGALLIWVDGRVQLKIMCKSESGANNCHAGSIETIAYMDGNSTILSAGEDGCIRKWSVINIQEAISTGVKGTVYVLPVATQMYDGAHIRHICTLDTSFLIQDCGRGLVTSWDNDTETPIISAHSGAITGCEASLTSTHLVTCDDVGSVHCYNYLSRTLSYKVRYKTAATALTNVPLSIDKEGRSVIVGFNDGSIRILVQNLTCWCLTLTLKPHSRAINAFSWSSSGKRLAIYAIDGSTFILNVFRVAHSFRFEPIGFVRLALSSSVFWESETVLGAHIADDTYFFDVPSAAFDSCTDTYEISVSPRVVKRARVAAVDDQHDVYLTHDGSHSVVIDSDGTFELYEMNTDSASIFQPIEWRTIHSETECLDLTSSKSLEEELQQKRRMELNENEAAAVIRLKCLVTLCRDELSMILHENEQLPKDMRLSGRDLLVDDLQIQRIHEESLQSLTLAHDKIRSSMERAESLSTQLQTAYFDKLKALPCTVSSSNGDLQCSSFALQTECDAATDLEEEKALKIQAISIDKDAIERIAATTESLDDERLAQVPDVSSEARRRCERARRTKMLQSLLNAEPFKTNKIESEPSTRDPLSRGFPLRCDPESYVPPEENLTMQGKLSELRHVEHKLFNHLSTFNQALESVGRAPEEIDEVTMVSLCHLKTTAVVRSMMTKISRLIVMQELRAMPEYDAKNMEMESARDRANEEVELARATVNTARLSIGEEQERLKQREKLKKDIETTFENIVMPPNVRKALLKVFHKRISNKTKAETDTTEKSQADSEYSDSELDSDFDDSSYCSSSEEEDNDACPKECDEAVYERVCKLRSSRIEAMDSISEVQRTLDAKKKVHDSVTKKLRVSIESARALENEATAFEKVKQQSLSGLTSAFILPVSCVDLHEIDHDNMIVFSKSRLEELENQLTDWEAEVQTLKRQQQDLKREHTSLVALRSAKTIDLRNLEKKHTEIQIRKFGKPVVLEELDQVLNSSQGTDDLRDKLKAQESKNAEEMRDLKKEIALKEKVVLALIETHTARLNELLAQNSSSMPAFELKVS